MLKQDKRDTFKYTQVYDVHKITSNTDDFLDPNATMEDTFSYLYSVLYFDINKSYGNIEYFNNTNVHQFLISEI